MKERYQGIDDKSEDLRDYLSTYREKGQEFLQRYEMSWIYHDSALEGVVYSPPELNAALRGDITRPAEASLWTSPFGPRTCTAAMDSTPSMPTTSLPNRIFTFGFARSLSERYVDILRRSVPLTSRDTSEALCDRNMAACPAELPAPTTWTGEFRHKRASTLVAL